MKKFITLLFAATALVATLASCSKDEEEEEISLLETVWSVTKSNVGELKTSEEFEKNYKKEGFTIYFNNPYTCRLTYAISTYTTITFNTITCTWWLEKNVVSIESPNLPSFKYIDGSGRKLLGTIKGKKMELVNATTDSAICTLELYEEQANQE